MEQLTTLNIKKLFQRIKFILKYFKEIFYTIIYIDKYPANL